LAIFMAYWSISKATEVDINLLFYGKMGGQKIRTILSE